MSDEKRKPPGRPFEKGHTRGGAPSGNQNAKRAGIWKQAIMRALERRGQGDSERALDKLATKLLGLVAKGDIMAIRELGDRLDGKPAQAVDLTNSDGSLSDRFAAAVMAANGINTEADDEAESGSTH